MATKAKKLATQQPAAQPSAWSEEDRAAHYANVDTQVAQAMKTIPLSGTGVDMLEWLAKNRGIGYRNLLKAAFSAANVR